ncbi:hypothetical protein [Streptomyces sp. MJP52]|uniref:hypothetical protein n=1 Tax=Streptomyces sp. MJP52 TaxID=2940555 RepID=UPI0024766EEF|nr:hypothetical protein [Streptomyces sp. MJP52]MDH6226191.1 hypothetical protein [Streptomyces sp. MJP52]
MICERCCQPIRKGEGYEVIPIDSPSGAVPDVVRHKRACKATVRQTAPVNGLAHRYYY